VVVLYRRLSDSSWTKVEPAYNSGQHKATATVSGLDAGQYEYFVQVVDGAGNVALAMDHGRYFQVSVSDAEVEGTIYVSPTSKAKIGSVTYFDNDILAYTPGVGWAQVFDGSDLKVKSVRNLAFLPGGSGAFLMTVGTKNTLPGLARQANPTDIIKFTPGPTSTGTATTGTFSLYLTGSLIGLTTGTEAIDGLAIDSSGALYISTTGNGSVPLSGGGSLSFQDEDILKFVPTGFGSVSNGTWSLYLDGTTTANSLTQNREDINALWLDSNGDIYLSTLSGYDVGGGLTGSGGEVLICGGTGANRTCDYREFWDAGKPPFDKGIDALDIVID
jgi:hypothetical protein